MGRSTAVLAVVLAAAAAPGCAAMAAMNAVPFEVGLVDLLPGDSVVITEVRGSHPTIVPGGTYRVRGRYILESRDAAVLEVSVMNGDSAGDRSKDIVRGQGTFDLWFFTSQEGYPHVSLYPVEPGRESFGMFFFGTGGSVWRKPFSRGPD